MSAHLWCRFRALEQPRPAAAELEAEPEQSAIVRGRRMHPRTQRFWKRVHRAVRLSFRVNVPIRVDEPPSPEIIVRFTDGNLSITLPSGRAITYPNARLVPGKYEDPDVSFYDNAH